MATFVRTGTNPFDNLVDRMIRAVDAPLTHAGETSKELRESFMFHWKGPKPEVVFTISETLTTKTLKVAIKGTGLGFMKWVWLKGTRVRYAQLTDDFIPKTSPDSISSRPGRGHMTYVDTEQPNPGIDDRRIKENAAAIVTPTLDLEIREALLAALKST